jgi:hypothetical protein
MAEQLSEELNTAIQDAVKREIARLKQESADNSVRLAQKEVGIDRPEGIAPRYVIYWTAVVR